MQSIARDSEDSTDEEFFDAHGTVNVKYSYYMLLHGHNLLLHSYYINGNSL